MEVALQPRMMKRKKSRKVKIREKAASKIQSRTECAKMRRSRDNQWLLKTPMSNMTEDLPGKKRHRRSKKRKPSLLLLIMKMMISMTHLKVCSNLMVERAMMLLIQLKVAETLRAKVVEQQQVQTRTKKIQCLT